MRSVLAVAMEQRILLGDTKSHFGCREVLSVAGLEQSVVIPSFSLLIRYRDSSGIEIGAGPHVSVSRVGVVVAIGWTFNLKGLYVPLDASWVLPSGRDSSMGTVGLAIGFDLQLRRRGRRR